MKCNTCGAEVEEVEIETPIGKRRGLRIVQFIGVPLCDKCQEKLRGS